ncbi:uncharacterized protein ACLA_039910 [Aspergillus clavatus NRRL 1]|uniref:Uncharacterized protein n=1 Tax=Aspergillus clavatus (strain ATCC 1007 / CBS 513.65 / DSM 816 / NCTC 3887 / NRRL 1 / QM 1276 / 107) TaxID=344612 RepID=A1CKV1_ASPCL|nr:uncharacterized protein ACLA_039910 [Aspergillus clavatus NRRL 1]EAW09775.1 conserved hypothetical protein [Aspergillus clavatus NRRL 1]
MSSSNFYAAEPAPPVLAHTLLPEPIPPCRRSEAQDTGDWNLRKDIESAFDDSSIFRYGTVIGFSRLNNKIHDDGNELIAQLTAPKLPRYLLTHHLLKPPSPSLSTPRAFIIHPATFSPFSPQALLASLLPSLPRNKAIALLDHVQLLPVFDFAAALQAISSVAAALHVSRPKEHEQQDQEGEANATLNPQRTLLLVAGLDTLTEGVIRASNPVRGAAALTAALRTLTHLARAHAGWVSVMLVNTSGLGSGSGPGLSGGLGGAVPVQGVGVGGGVYSAFHAETALLSTLLMRTLDQGVDTHLLLSTVRMEYVVEVVKDRAGDGVGRWCVWEKM